MQGRLILQYSNVTVFGLVVRYAAMNVWNCFYQWAIPLINQRKVLERGRLERRANHSRIPRGCRESPTRGCAWLWLYCQETTLFHGFFESQSAAFPRLTIVLL